MTTLLPPCPKCQSAFVYEDRGLWNCPECGHEWIPGAAQGGGDEDTAKIVRDANGNELKDGDTVTIIKDLKVGNSAIKVGTKVKNIRVLPPEQWVGDHDIEAKVPGFGPMGLKSSVVKKIAE
jgi:protein PhnA